MGFKHNEVNFMNILRCGDKHMWPQDWHHYFWTLSCQVLLFISSIAELFNLLTFDSSQLTSHSITTFGPWKYKKFAPGNPLVNHFNFSHWIPTGHIYHNLPTHLQHREIRPQMMSQWEILFWCSFCCGIIYHKKLKYAYSNVSSSFHK